MKDDGEPELQPAVENGLVHAHSARIALAGDIGTGSGDATCASVELRCPVNKA